jgi:two-component system, NtrC family, response regulator AtoC
MFAEGVKVLLIEDEEYDVRRVRNTLSPFSDRIKITDQVSNGKAALDILKNNREHIDVVIMDFQIAGGLMGEELIRQLKSVDESVQIIVITKMTINISDYNFANNLIKAGAFWYCTKYPVDVEDYIYQPTDFIMSVFNAYNKSKLERERRRSNQKFIKNVEDILQQKKIIGVSEQTEHLRKEIQKCANSNFSTLLRGMSGTGKELVAYNIHYYSPRKFENFIPINCGSIPGELVESELFGYEKGSFTGAGKRKSGLFELAHKGTIFLDEVTELPLNTQVKLLRVIQEGEIEKIGRTEKIKVDVRIIAATNKNIEEEVKAKRFREDLYFRLNVISVCIPELKERKEDIPVLFDYFLTNISIDMGRDKPVINSEAMEFFINYTWPGNVRELKNVVQRVLFSGEDIITYIIAKRSVGLFEMLRDDASTDNIEFPSPSEIIPLKTMEKLFREKYFKFVRRNSESDTDASNKLGLAPPNFHRMCKELGLK